MIGNVRWRSSGIGAIWLVAGLHTTQLCAQPAGPQPVDFPSAATRPAQLAAPSAASAPRTPRAADPWRLVIDAPADLAALLNTYLDLARYEREGLAAGAAAGAASGGAASAPSAPASASSVDASASGPAAGTSAASDFITRGELRRLVSALPAQVRELLLTEGYMDPVVEARLEPGQPQIVRVKVEPGPQVQVRDVELRFEGELGERFDAGDASATATQADMRRSWGLPAGSPFRQDDWNAAKNAAIARLRAGGYPAATWSGTSARIDAAKRAARLFVLADSGPLFHFGDVRIEGLRYYSADSVRNVQTFRAGDPYSDKAVFDFQERLQKLGVFENVSVTMDTDLALAAAAPVTVQLRELPRRQVTFGAGVSANTGPRLSTEYVDRNLFGLDWQSKTSAEVGRDQSNVQVDLTSYPLVNRHRNLLSLAVTDLNASGTRTTSERLRVGRTQDGDRIERTGYLEWQRATVRDVTVISEASAVTANYQWVWRHLDSIVLPTEGWAVSVAAGGGRSYATQDSASGPFSREQLKLLAYLPLGAKWYANARIEVGGVQAEPHVGVPDTLLFRAGGDDSVRGYAYRGLGPTLDGVAVGGRALTTGSLELARPISPRHAAWWVAAFVDAGDAATRWSQISPKLGYGLGLRWRSPVGPLRLDLAYGQAERRLRTHFSVGIAF